MSAAHDKLAEALAGMTGPEWIAAPYSSVVGAPIVASPSGRPIANVTYFALGPEFANHDAESKANAAGIVALRNHAPAAIAEHAALLARVKVLEAENARLRTPNGYWHEGDREYGYVFLDDLLDDEPYDAVVEVRPWAELPKLYAAFVDDKWQTFATEEAARAALGGAHE